MEFFCKYCRKSRPTEWRVKVINRLGRFSAWRCAACEESRKRGDFASCIASDKLNRKGLES